jgi:Xaa-Pro aminopeptidase
MTPEGSMVGEPPLILYSGGSGDADFYYACGVEIEQALYVRYAEGDDLLVVPRLELERAQLEARAARVADRGEFDWTERQDPLQSWGELAVRLLRDRGAAGAVSSPRLFAALYRTLTAAGLDVELDQRLFLEERRRKSDLEAAAIRAAQRAAEAACVEVIRSLAAASPGADGTLELEGRPLTSEMLMARAQFVLNEHGHSTPAMIIAGSPDCALAHFRGAGPIKSGAPVIIDVFPRGNASRFHGDLTRTVVPGKIPDTFRRMHDASVAALEAAIAELRAGADGREVHRTACRVLVEHGYGTVTTGFEGNPEGPRMTHSTGHGVGLEVHEAPQLRDLEYPLAEGDVVTVEPGLYQVGLGGVRVEDTGMVTADGFDDFTTLPRSLDPRAYP